GLGGRKRLVQRRRRVGVQLVHHQHDALRVGIVRVDQLLDAVRPVDPRALRTHAHGTPAAQGLADHEHIDHTSALVLRIVAGPPPGRQRQRPAHVGQHLPAGLIEADLRAARVVRAGVHVQHVRHMPDELGVGGRRDAPLLLQPRLELVCLKTWRTVSYDTASATSRRTRASASSRSVQRVRPAGGAPQARAIRRASCAPSSFRAYCRSGTLRSGAASRPAAPSARRTRWPVAGWPSKAPARAASVQPGPPSPWLAFSRIRAWASRRAGPVPRPRSVWSRARSASVSSTPYFVFTHSLRADPRWGRTQRVPSLRTLSKSPLTDH